MLGRLNTWGQGSHFIEMLADEFGVPEHALTNRRSVEVLSKFLTVQSDLFEFDANFRLKKRKENDSNKKPLYTVMAS